MLNRPGVLALLVLSGLLASCAATPESIETPSSASLSDTLGELRRCREAAREEFILRDSMLGRWCGYELSSELAARIEKLSRMPLLPRAVDFAFAEGGEILKPKHMLNMFFVAVIHALLLWEDNFGASTDRLRAKVFEIGTANTGCADAFKPREAYEREIREFMCRKP